MDTSRIKPMPQQSTDLTIKILDFLTTFIPYATVFGIFWKIVDAVLKYSSEGRDARTRELIDERIVPLSKEIRELTQSIGVLSNKLNQ